MRALLAFAVAVALVGAASPSPDLEARGAYLTSGAGQCADCHLAGLVGGPNRIAGPPGVPWPHVIPSLRGLTMFPTDADAIAFFRTGVLPGGGSALRPMPQYRYDEADATAIVAYLRSLK